MAIILLKNMTKKVNIIEQQQHVLKYAATHGIPIHSTEIETSDASLVLEDRKEFKGFLRSLNNNETLLVYDVWALSTHVDELAKVFECLLKRDITLHVCHTEEIVSSSLSALNALSVLVRIREEGIHPKEQASQGRPKGRMSQSKFDTYRAKVIEYLEEGISVSEIAKLLHVSRSSLKDYINSRGLKELAKTKKKLLYATPTKQPTKEKKPEKECELIAQPPLGGNA
ncbi:recombinase family protein [Sulfurospirillum sp. T05]|uniref:Recombinase family protein n=1 Tax=Sulfurospirillum tamanense TaxID=2813362 RepID=A0ABS2WR22_9BACT|nr:recombinase family protein [Sulfurospirillum tamanensis]MBN2964040.1 recombinase family protein [Sulfurospirillum tamanensis]